MNSFAFVGSNPASPKDFLPAKGCECVDVQEGFLWLVHRLVFIPLVQNRFCLDRNTISLLQFIVQQYLVSEVHAETSPKWALVVEDRGAL